MPVWLRRYSSAKKIILNGKGMERNRSVSERLTDYYSIKNISYKIWLLLIF